MLTKQLISQRPGQAIIEHLPAKTQEEEARMVVEKIVELKGKSQKLKVNESITNSVNNKPLVSDFRPPTSDFRPPTSNPQFPISNFQSPTSNLQPLISITWNDFAILVRANSQAEIFCQALEQAGIPYQFLASSGLYAKPIILDILAYLKLLDNYHESPALYRILNLPVFKLSSKDIIDLNYWARRKTWSLYETLKRAASLNVSKQGVNEINKILSLIEKHSQMAREKSVGKVTFAFLEDTGYLKLLTDIANLHESASTNLHESTTNNTNNICDIRGKFVPIRESINIRESLNYLNQFFKKIEEFERTNPDKSAKAFQEEIEMAREAGEMGALERDIEEGPESVKILTIHGAKGLEFRYVFITNLVDRRFPTIEKKDPIEMPDALVKEIIPEGDIHLQEERRLFYVAMTRAKDGLFFTSAEDYGGQRKKKPSRFLEETGITNHKAQITNYKQIPNSKSQITNKFQFPISNFQTNSKFKIQNSNLPKRFSFTQLKAFETCPLQYKFAHILHVPVKGRFTFSFGKSMHNALYRFFRKMMERGEHKQESLFKLSFADLRGKATRIYAEKPLISLDELLKIYETCWIDDWYESKTHQEEYKEKGRKILKEFYEKLKNDPPRPKYLELGFNFRLGDYTIKGVIDRVDIITNLHESANTNLHESTTNNTNNICDIRGKFVPICESIEIIDYKTGKVKNEENLSIEDKEQLLIYQLAAQTLFREKVAKLSYYYLDENKKASFLGTNEELETMKKKILNTIEEIKKSNFLPQPNVYKCNFCDFKEICEYRLC